MSTIDIAKDHVQLLQRTVGRRSRLTELKVQDRGAPNES